MSRRRIASAFPFPKLHRSEQAARIRVFRKGSPIMPLMTTKPMFDLAQSIIDACAKEKSPLILQISKGARKYANIRYLKAIIDAAVQEHPELPIAIHCDHGDTVELIKTCIAD